MFKVSPQAIAGLEATEARAVRLRFCGWWQAHAQWLGHAPAEALFAAFDRHSLEGEFAGLDAEEDLFQFTAGRVLIPNCEDAAYEALLNLICDDEIDGPTRVVTIARWAGRQV